MIHNRQLIQSIIRFLINLLVNIRLEGLEHIPAAGSFLLAANHISRMDAPVLISLPLRPDITAFMADKYQNHWFFGWFGRTMKFIFIDRSKADFSAFRDAIEVMKNGIPLAIAPEGTRSPTGRMLEGKPGVILLAIKTGAPCIPAAVTGTDKILKGIFTLRRPTIKISFGHPLVIPPLEREERDRQLQKWTDELMCRIAAMLPAERHGFYADHPRLKELLAMPSV